jgi:hypothetical protein
MLTDKQQLKAKSKLLYLTIDRFCTHMLTDEQQSKEKSKLIIGKFCSIIMLTDKQQKINKNCALLNH